MKKIIFALLLLAFVTPSLICQEDVLRPRLTGDRLKGQSSDYEEQYYAPFILGIEAGINYNFFAQNMTWYTPSHGTVYDGLTSANGFSPHIGILGILPINKTFGIQMKIAYDKKTVGKNTAGEDYNDIMTVPAKHPVSLKTELNASYLTIAPALKIEITDRWFATVGPTIHLLLGKVQTTWTPNSVDGTPLGNMLFWRSIGYNQETTGTKTIDEIPSNTESTRVGIEAGVGYKIPISNKVWLVPQARLQYMVTNVTKDLTILNYETSSKRSLNSIQFALALWFGF